MTRRLEMTINLSVLEHLGLNLYSTIPAVLSEVVANAWDADATHVNVQFDKEAGWISIQDDGTGMTRDEVIDRFLRVGFRRRETTGDVTALYHRRPMGRKGIGKLSSFSIANIVTVYTIRNGEKTAFSMDVDKIKEAIRAEDEGADRSLSYSPDEVSDWPSDLISGTCIVLSGLKQKTTKLTHRGLRQRLARRFAVIGPKYDFKVTVDGQEISPADRGYYEHVEYLWTYGDQSERLDFFSHLAKDRNPEDRTSKIADSLQKSGLQLSGWIGTVKHSGSLKDEEGENLNRIAVFMRGKLAQEDVLDDFGQKEIYADYVVGEIYCDDLDNDDEDDIATSSRQSLKYDDPRFEAVRGTVLGELRHIASRWSDWRRRDGAKAVVGAVPEVTEWMEGLKGDTKTKAERWIGRLNVIRSDKDTEKRELLKASILAFESYRRKEQLDFLDKLSDQIIEPILTIFKDIDDLELSYYGQIVKLRLGVIKTLEEKLDADELEKVIQKHIYDHLWLLDPSWERAKGSDAMERSVANFLKENSKGLSRKQRKARIDIGYRTASGRHVIVELKRASVSTPVDELAAQIRTYRDGAKQLIQQSNYADWPLDIICLVGEPPPEWNEGSGGQDVEETLASVNARLVFYNQLLDNSYRAYADYLEKHKKIDRLWRIFQGIDDFAAVSDTE